ncbi:cystatin-like fold lipoprotein [Staphylococcus caprae]|uniref:cystatin-like fold lipoprotein n=1 Tax=Staphylococcus caprae TaxID=29380 RepID=UPI000E69FA6D|nr:cystatin-like fold lipoprotein [Staphylococcus caprae]RIM33688.1 cystatin-like fold lipoprotein [Staphylococcus caprae]
MKKYYAFLLSLVLILGACGNKYDEEIDSVAKEVNKDISKNDQEFVRYNKDKANTYVYDDGNIIILNYKSMKDSDVDVYKLYKKNQTTGDYEYESGAAKKYMKNNEPVYKEENMK